MLTYLSGYNFVDDNGQGECDRCIPLEPWPLRDSPRRMCWDEWLRYVSWFALFKELEFITKDDTVYTYLCSICNLDLDPFTWFDWYENSPLYKVNYAKYDRDQEGITPVPTIRYSSAERPNKNAVKFPKELIKMADNYRACRTVEFVDNLIYTATESEFGSVVSYGSRFPRAVITAVEGFNPVASSLNSIVENCKALYASVVPELFCDNYRSSIRGSTKSFLRYDSSRNLTSYHDDGDSSIVGKSFIKCHRYIVDLLRSRLRQDMCDAIMERDIATCNQVREAILAVIGVLAYISSVSNGSLDAGSWQAFSLSASDCNANMFRLKDSADRKDIFNDRRCDRDNIDNAIIALTGMSPDTALCVGDMCGGMYGTKKYKLDRLAEYLAEKRAVSSITIGKFLKNEFAFQVYQWRVARERIKTFREGAGK